MSRIFISHSSKDSAAAKAFKQWLGANGWPDEDVFLDLDDIGAGERWKEALRKANARCEAVILLASPYSLSSPECLAEIRKAEDYGKEVIVVLLHDIALEDGRLESLKDRQIVNLGTPPPSHLETVDLGGERYEVRFNGDALARVKRYLFDRGISPDNFIWPPKDRPDAEPYPGLEAFNEGDAGIFFGRDSDILRGLDKLRVLRRNGRVRLLVIQASSGAGKSSYLRAGLWPRLKRDADFAPVAILRPARGILTGPEGLGSRLADELSTPAVPVARGEVHAELTNDDRAHAAANFASLMARVGTQAHDRRRIGDPYARVPALIVGVDQAEEMFGTDDAAESQRFLTLLAEVLRSPATQFELYCVFTIRSDRAARLFEVIAEHGLEMPETLPLLPLPQSSYRDVILKPLQVLARRGQSLTVSPMLVDRLVADSIGADALPLLAFTISHLYREFGATRQLSLDQYESIGGVAGSIDMALRAALAHPDNSPTIPLGKEEQLELLRSAFIPWLARIDVSTGMPMRRVARRSEIPLACRPVVDRLVKARLIVVDRRDGIDIVEVAHESLLRRWKTLAGWLEEAAADLKVIEAIERAAAEWGANGRTENWLDHRGDRLRYAQRLVAREQIKQRFADTCIAYLDACEARDEAERADKEAALAREGARLAEIAAAQARTARLQRVRTWALASAGAAVVLGVMGVGGQQLRVNARQRALVEKQLALDEKIAENKNLNAVLLQTLEKTKPRTAAGEIALDFTATTKDPAKAAQAMLARYGIKVRYLAPASSRVELVPHTVLYLDAAVVPTTSPNFLTQIDTGNTAASFTLVFSKPVEAFTFVRPNLYRATQSGVTFPAWKATALDSDGRTLSEVSEALLRSTWSRPGDVSAQTYRLRTPNFHGIAAVRFDSDPRLDGRPFAAFSTLLIERIVLTPQAVPVALNSVTPAIESAPAS